MATWVNLKWKEDRVLKRLANEATQQQTELAKLSMEIRGLRVSIVEPQPPPGRETRPRRSNRPPRREDAILQTAE
ncbi:unnamed protein product [Sphacelaria rigidula]